MKKKVALIVPSFEKLIYVRILGNPVRVLVYPGQRSC